MIACDHAFLTTAMQNYDNPSCIAVDEFQQDLYRITNLRKAFVRYQETGEINERLVLNNIIILYNVFGESTTDLILYKIEKEYHNFLFPFLIFLNRVSDEILSKYSFELDSNIVKKLREL